MLCVCVVGADKGILWVGGYFLWWVGACGNKFWLGGRCVDTFYGWERVGGGLFWVSGGNRGMFWVSEGGWTIFMGRWGVGGGGRRYILDG